MVQQISRLPLEALRIGDATSELARVVNTPYDTEVGLDFETTGKNPREHQMVMIQLKPKGRKVVLLDARDEDVGVLHTALLPLVTDARRTFTGQNLLFEMHWLLSHIGFEVDDLRARFSDTMLRELVILGLGFGDAKKRGMAVNMHDIAERYGFTVHKEERSWFFDLDKRPEWYEPFPQAQLEYGRQDVSVVHLISGAQQKLIDEYGLQEVIDLEARVLPATAGMQHYGLFINREKWLEIIAGISSRANELATTLHAAIDIPVMETRRLAWAEKNDPYQKWAKAKEELIEIEDASWPKTPKGKRQKGWGEHKIAVVKKYEEDHPKPKAPPGLKDGVNLDSPAQIKIAMWSRGHLVDSVREEVVSPLSSDPVVQTYLDYKDFSTARTKYGEKYLSEHAPDGVIFSSIQQVGTETGRYSFKEPNVQQVPSKGAGEHLREAVVPRPGYVFVDADFVNVELMITAYITRDPVMLKAFADQEDLHARTAEVMFGLRSKPEYLAALESGIKPKPWTDSHNAVVNGKELNESYRSIAKTINFGLLYGMGAGRLASKLRIDVQVARELMRLYRETYKVAVAWLRKQGRRIEKPDKDGRVYASTLSGRRRWFEVPKLVLDKNTTAEEAKEALDKHNRKVAEIQRQLGNHPIQGTSADITKWAIGLWQDRYNSNDMRLVATIHDELLLEVRDDPLLIEEANNRLGEVMHEALTHFLKGMDARVPVGVVADHWQH